MKTITFATLVAAAMLTGCSSSKTIAPLTSLAGEWTIEKIDGNAIDKKAGDEVPFMGFDTTAKRIYGNTGCNSLTGELKADNGKINLDNMGSTRMMCADMTNERKVLEALGKVNGYEIDAKGNLLLTNAQGKEVILLVKKK